MNKVGNVGKSFALCASVATFMHGSAEKIYKSHILRTATITRTSSTRSLTVQAQNLYAESFQKTSLEWYKIPPISEILWDDRVGWPTFHKISRFKISVLLHVLHCVAQKRSGGHEVIFVLHLPCEIDIHVPCLATWINASTMRQTRGNHHHFKSTQSTHATQNNENILAAGNSCKAPQLNHIDRCDPTSSCIHFP